MNLSISLVDNSDLLLNALQEQITAGMTAVGMAAESNVKTELDHAVYDTPESPNYVRTGRLRNSITYELADNDHSVLVGTNVTYAKFVEAGTMKMAARPYLRPGVVDHVSEYKDLIEEALSK